MKTNDTKHTPGPWLVVACRSHDGSGAHAFDIQVENETLAHVYPSEDMEANARLIAAAPELLQIAVLVLSPHLTEAGLRETLVPMARAAIAKATGQA